MFRKLRRSIMWATRCECWLRSNSRPFHLVKDEPYGRPPLSPGGALDEPFGYESLPSAKRLGNDGPDTKCDGHCTIMASQIKESASLAL